MNGLWIIKYSKIIKDTKNLKEKFKEEKDKSKEKVEINEESSYG